VAKLDRLTRSVRDLGELCASHDVALASVAETSTRRLRPKGSSSICWASVAQCEREAIDERTATTLAHKRRNGRVYGRRPSAIAETATHSSRARLSSTPSRKRFAWIERVRATTK
jgi:DNA invertase Pin-like site-specific DNA recombinase